MFAFMILPVEKNSTFKPKEILLCKYIYVTLTTKKIEDRKKLYYNRVHSMKLFNFCKQTFFYAEFSIKKKCTTFVTPFIIFNRNECDISAC